MFQEQRNKASFERSELSHTIYGGPKKFQIFLQIQSQVCKRPQLIFDPSKIQTSRQENIAYHNRKILKLLQILNNRPQNYSSLGSLFASEALPLSQHIIMFIPTLENLCDDQQIKMFLQPTKRGEIIGCYAQSELSHGSDIRSLKTTATFDQNTKQFIINTPSIQAAKWWVADLAFNANHAAIFAQLIIKGKNYGVHAFIVPIRDKNHKLFSTVQIGDIGPKYGYATRDNGYAIFNNHRIPRKNMLMKYTVVDEQGNYSRAGDQRISYATMLLVRAMLPEICFYSYSKTTVIGTRYSLVRKQFKNDFNQQIPILDYQLQQDKIIPRIAQVYAIMFASKRLNEFTNEVYTQVKQKNDFSRLNQAHVLISGLKAIITHDSVAGMQVIRRACGGHGFSMYSGIPGAINQSTALITLEGQNSILLLQVARFVTKSLEKLNQGSRLSSTNMYLTQAFNQNDFTANFDDENAFFKPQNMRKIFLYQSCKSAKIVSQKFMEKIVQGQNPKQVWDYKAGISLVQAATSHIYYWIIENFILSIYSRTQNEKVRSVLFKLFCLYATDKILQRSQMFFQTKVMTPSDMKYCFKAKEELLKQLRPEALALVQAFEYDDNTLCSAIGRSDGKAYETLLDWAKNKNVVNKPQIKKQINKWIKQGKQILKSKL